jgi:hypothetical protein
VGETNKNIAPEVAGKINAALKEGNVANREIKKRNT